MSQTNTDLNIAYEMVSRPNYDRWVRMNVDRHSQELVCEFMWFEGHKFRLHTTAVRHVYRCLIHEEWPY